MTTQPEWASEITELMTNLKTQIEDDERASDDPDDDIPEMQVTISTDKEWSEWSYQTGDNSYFGACYFHKYWGVVSLYRNSTPAEIAKDAIDQIADLIYQ